MSYNPTNMKQASQDCDKVARCPFLEKLPVEVRLQIYGEIVRFDAPIKLRQVIPGSKDLPILRANKQIHEEALSVLYDANHIVVTRNDFCKRTEKSLKTPLRLEDARHLVMGSFSQSIVCAFGLPIDRCDVCQPSAAGLIQAFTEMPRLQTVLIDYHKYVREMELFKKSFGSIGGLELEPIPMEGYLGIYNWQLVGPAVGDLKILFHYAKFSERLGHVLTPNTDAD